MRKEANSDSVAAREDLVEEVSGVLGGVYVAVVAGEWGHGLSSLDAGPAWEALVWQTDLIS